MTAFPIAAASPVCGAVNGAPFDAPDRLARIFHGALGALRAGREVERLMALSDEALARQGLSREEIVASALRRNLPD